MHVNDQDFSCEQGDRGKSKLETRALVWQILPKDRTEGSTFTFKSAGVTDEARISQQTGVGEFCLYSLGNQ